MTDQTSLMQAAADLDFAARIVGGISRNIGQLTRPDFDELDRAMEVLRAMSRKLAIVERRGDTPQGR